MHSVSDTLVPPDGGWGWMVVFGTAWANTFNQSLLSVFGLLFGDKLKEMGLNSVGTSWIANVMLLVTNFSGLISGPALKKYSPRQVAVLGSILSGIGMIACAYSTNVWQLILSYSILTGLGIGFIQPSTFMAVNSYFTTKKGRAVGISMAGTGVGQLLMPQLVGILLDIYGFSGASLVLGSLAFNGVVGAALFQPVKLHMKVKKSEETGLLTSSSHLDENRNIKKYGTSNPHEDDNKIEESDVLEVKLPIDRKSKGRREEHVTICIIPCKGDIFDIKHKPERESVLTKLKRTLDLDLLKSLTFLNIIVSCGLGFTSNQNFNMFFPLYLQQEVNLNRNQAAMCMSAIAATDIIGRIALPTLTDKYKITSRVAYVISCVCLAFSRIVLSFQSQYLYIILASALCGFCRSILVVNQNLIVSDYCKDNPEKIPIALGLNMFMKGVVVITLGQLLGWVRDETQSYTLTIHAQNSLLFVIFAMWAPEALYKYLHKEKG